MLKIKVKSFETKYHSFYKTLLKKIISRKPTSMLGILSFYNNTRHLADMVLSFFIGFSFSKSYTHNNLNPLLNQHILTA